jgi:hypothetical protein
MRSACPEGKVAEREDTMFESDYRWVTVQGQAVTAIDGQSVTGELRYATVFAQLRAEGWCWEHERAAPGETAIVQFRRRRALV